MAVYGPDEDVPLPSPYDHPWSGEAGLPPDTTFGNIPYPYHSHQVEIPPPPHGYWYDMNDHDGGSHDFGSSYGVPTGNDQVLPYHATYASGGLSDVGPMLPPNHMATVPTLLYPSSASPPVPASGTCYDTLPYPTPGMSFPSASTTPQVQGPSDTEATLSGHGPRCLWGTPACGQRLANGSSATVRTHLRDAHGIGLGTGVPNAKRASARCLWGGECSLSSERILVSGIGKHVATCHLKTTSLSCGTCGRVCSRQDALRRHADLYCPGLEQMEGRGRGEPTKRRSQRAETSAVAAAAATTAPPSGNFTWTSAGV